MQRQAILELPEQPHKVQLQNKALWNSTRSREIADFFTLGYAGRSIQEIVDALSAANVATLVDVRFNPVSMFKPEFSKSNLARILADNGIQYLHRPDLGVPRDIRVRAISSGSRQEIWVWYDRYVVAPFVGRNLDAFLNWADHPVALMCAERDPVSCHRHRLCRALENQGLRGYDL